MSRRDRKSRHLAVAAHLRESFPNEGEEVAEVIAHHYLDAIIAVPEDEDVPELRADAVAAMTRAGKPGAAHRSTSSSRVELRGCCPVDRGDRR